MALKKGDTVTLSVSPTVPLAPYINLKPSASVTVTLGSDVVSDLADAQVELRRLLMLSAALELGVANDLTRAVKSGDLENYIERELQNGRCTSTEAGAVIPQEDDCGVPKVVRKGPTKVTRAVG